MEMVKWKWQQNNSKSSSNSDKHHHHHHHHHHQPQCRLRNAGMHSSRRVLEATASDCELPRTVPNMRGSRLSRFTGFGFRVKGVHGAEDLLNDSLRLIYIVQVAGSFLALRSQDATSPKAT